MSHKVKIGIRPVIDGRWMGVREGLEEQTMNMARAAKQLHRRKLLLWRRATCVIAEGTIAGWIEGGGDFGGRGEVHEGD
jgi:L-fucose isomerase